VRSVGPPVFIVEPLGEHGVVTGRSEEIGHVLRMGMCFGAGQEAGANPYRVGGAGE
jgi:hypothetical protein